MSDAQVGMICGTIVVVAIFALVALRIWFDHMEAMK